MVVIRSLLEADLKTTKETRTYEEPATDVYLLGSVE